MYHKFCNIDVLTLIILFLFHSIFVLATLTCSRPDGTKRLFSLHAKLREFNWRIYFYPVQPGEVIIGYIGVHLPTVKYK